MNKVTFCQAVVVGEAEGLTDSYTPRRREWVAKIDAKNSSYKCEVRSFKSEPVKKHVPREVPPVES